MASVVPNIQWVPDSEATNCNFCNVQFGFVTRRHHCRACGHVFCSACSAHRVRLTDYGIHDLVRVCLPCHKKYCLEDIWESASFTVRYYLRSHSGFRLVSPLFEASRRDAREKSMFLVQDSTDSQYIVSLVAPGAHCSAPYSSSESARCALKRLLTGLRHPYVWPITEAEFLEDRDMAVVVQPLCPRGSLRDVMHWANPKGVYGQKYKRAVVSPLGAADIALYGRQILEALLYLTNRSFRISYLHAGNVMLHRRCCYLAGVENDLLGLSNEFTEGAGVKMQQSEEVLGFGRLLFEMATGQVMQSQILPGLNEKNCVPPFSAILRSIFSPSTPQRPSLQDLVAAKPFSEVQLLADVTFIHQAPIDAKCQRLLQQVGCHRSGSVDSALPVAEVKQKSTKPRKGKVAPPIGEGGEVTSLTGGVTVALQEEGDSVADVAPESSVDGRGELLSAIRNVSNRNLRKTGARVW